jgi:hypothetical protein
VTLSWNDVGVWFGVVVAVVTLFFVVKSWRLQRKQHQTSVAAQPIDGDHLWVLRQLIDLGPLNRSAYRLDGVGSVRTLRFGDGAPIYRPEHDQRNAWFFASLTWLDKTGLIVGNEVRSYKTTEEGRAVLRAKAGQSVNPPPLVFAPYPKP